MTKLTRFCALSLAAGQAFGAPHPPQRRALPDEYKWPNYCNETNYRDAALLSNSNNAIVNAVRGYAELNYKSTNAQGEGVPLPLWISRMSPVHYDWSCNSAGCDLGPNFNEACRSGGGSGPMGVTLEQIKNFYAFLKSVSRAIENQRDYLVAHMGVLFEAFGGELKDGEPWDKKLGAVTAGVGALAAIAPGSGPAMAAGIGFATAIAAFLLPEEEKEQNFKWASHASSTFAENVQIIMSTIDTWIDLNLMKPIDDIKTYVNMDGNLFFMVQEGKFAIDPQPPLLSSTDNNILAGLSAPMINQLWRDQQIAVIVFDGKAWRDAGFDLCGNFDLKFYEDLQPDRRICDGDGNLQLIMRFADLDKDQKDYKEIARGVVGIDDMTKYGTNRDQVIEGSVENHKAGGFDYGLTPEEAIERLKTMQNVDQLAWGKVNVWNLPVCYTGPIDNSEHKDDVEYWMAVSMLFTCGGQQDQGGKNWPYGDPWCGGPESSC